MKILYVLITLNASSPVDPIDQIAPASPTRIEELAPLPTYDSYLSCAAAAWHAMNSTIPRDAPNRYELQARNAQNYRCLKIQVPQFP